MTLTEILAEHSQGEGTLLPILHAVQHEFGYISEAHIRDIASELNLGRAEVSGVVSFYHDFSRIPDLRPVIQFCRAEACQARGSEQLSNYAEKLCGKRVRIETVYCLGLCSVGPSAMIGENVYAHLDEDSLARMIDVL